MHVALCCPDGSYEVALLYVNCFAIICPCALQISLQVDHSGQLSPLQLSSLAEDPSSLINKYLNSSDELELSRSISDANTDKLNIPVSSVRDLLEGFTHFLPFCSSSPMSRSFTSQHITRATGMNFCASVI